MKTNIKIIKPSIAEAEKWINNKTNKIPVNYIEQEKSIKHLFNNVFPNNNNFSEILIKCAVLNDFDSTNVFNIYKMASHIYQIKDLDKRLKERDIKLVKKIASVNISGKKKNFYSFATKYCCHHNNNYPIYDSYVAKILKYFRNKYRFYDFTDADLKKYRSFVKIIDSFKKEFGLEHYNAREIDLYLWSAGRTYFPNKYYK